MEYILVLRPEKRSVKYINYNNNILYSYYTSYTSLSGEYKIILL